MVPNQVDGAGADGLKTLCMDPILMLDIAAAINGHGGVSTPYIVGSNGLAFFVTKSRVENPASSDK